MKYCVLANVKFTNTAKRDSLARAVDREIEGKATWGEVINKKYDDPISQGIEIRFEDEADWDKLFSFLKDKIDETDISLGGKINKHYCFHDRDNGIERPCETIERYER